MNLMQSVVEVKTTYTYIHIYIYIYTHIHTDFECEILTCHGREEVARQNSE